MAIICEVCGNEMSPEETTCPYCEHPASFSGALPSAPVHRVVNLEQGMPTVERALERLVLELESSKRQGFRVVTLIHGYGSTGKGGAIREAVRSRLQYYKYQGQINEVLLGEQFSSRSGAGRQLLRRFPSLASHHALNRANPGITLVVI